MKPRWVSGLAAMALTAVSSTMQPWSRMLPLRCLEADLLQAGHPADGDPVLLPWSVFLVHAKGAALLARAEGMASA